MKKTPGTMIAERKKQQIPEEAICRIRQMEALFDALQHPDAKADPRFAEQLQTLMQYYENGLWLQDYRLDELGQLPADLKRGVLSEDGVYNFLAEQDSQ